MERFFNTTGPCHPTRHSVLPPRRRLPQLPGLVDRQLYFIVHGPRQTGKTTALRAFAEAWTAEGRYAALHTSCETGAGADLDEAIEAILWSIQRAAEEALPAVLRPEPVGAVADAPPRSRLVEYLARWCRRSPRPVVLILDEIDTLGDEALLSVLHQLRSGHPNRPEHFPAAIGLIGSRDLRADPDRHGSSTVTALPLDLDVESVAMRNFTLAEVAELVHDHAEATGQTFEADAVVALHTSTGGHPWLVNALARLAIDLREHEDAPVTPGVLEQARDTLVLRRESHLDALVDRLHDARVQRVIEPILTGELPAEEVHDDDLRTALDLGLVAMGESGLEIANPIYREVVPRALTRVVEAFLPVSATSYRDTDGMLHLDRLVDDFGGFWHEHAERILDRRPYRAAAAPLAFMACLQRAVNGGGFIDREYGVGQRRIDLCVRWPHEGGVDRWVAELRVWRPSQPDPLDRGLDDLVDYLERLGLKQGTLILFDLRSKTPPAPRHDEVEHGGHRLRVVRL
ncbi:MAG: ATP-binding protein [Acidobacteriota bacterium]